MDIFEAVKARHSVRSYTDKPIESEKTAELQRLIDEINAETGLHFQLVTDEPKGFSGMMAHYGSFSGVKNYFVLAGGAKRDRDVGYYGEKLVLAAQMLGLNTCWVALTFNKRKAHYQLNKGEKLHVVISLGYGATQGREHKSKPVSEIAQLDGTPDWFRSGIDSVMLAPTAVNQQKFRFFYEDGKVKSEAGSGFYTDMDLGIAQYHFDIGSGRFNDWTVK